MIDSYHYATYIRATPDRVWAALTDADATAKYWGHSNISDWEVGSTWEHVRIDGSGIADVVGRVLVADPPGRLAVTFEEPGSTPPDGPTRVTFAVAPFHDIVRVTVTHDNLATAAAREAVARGWPAVVANLKTLLETGDVLPQAPWEMPWPEPS